MPSITRKTVTHKVVGIVCDRCGKRDEDRLNDFILRQTFGYDSAADMSSVEAAICDDCLIDIVLEMVPNAQFRNEYGKAVSREAFKAGVETFRAAQKKAARNGQSAKWKRTGNAWVFALRSGGFQQGPAGDLRLKHYDPETGQPLYSPLGVLFEVLGIESTIVDGMAFYSPDNELRMASVGDQSDIGDDAASSPQNFRGFPRRLVAYEADIGDDEAVMLKTLCGFPNALRHVLRIEAARGRSFAEFADILDEWFAANG